MTSSTGNPEKLIFAPGAGNMNSQAEQFTLNRPLRARDLDAADPVRQFGAWFRAAQAAMPDGHPEACCLATAALPSGRVSARMVYLKELGADGGFVVYTNTATSRKAADLVSNPHAAITFFWEPVQRQVRVEGRCELLSAAESAVYFDTRARGSRIGAWASMQTAVLEPANSGGGGGGGGGGTATGTDDGDEDDGRLELEQRTAEVEERFRGQEHIPVPPHWGGLRLVPDRMELWQGRNNRLHDRFGYELDKSTGKWKLERLSP